MTHMLNFAHCRQKLFPKVARRSVQEEDGLKLLQLRSESSAQRRTYLGHDLMVHPSRLASLHYDFGASVGLTVCRTRFCRMCSFPKMNWGSFG